jgi:hypothetical protein
MTTVLQKEYPRWRRAQMKVLYLETPTGYGGSMQSLLELIGYLPDEIEPVVAVPYDVRQYRTVPEKIRWEIIDAPKPQRLSRLRSPVHASVGLVSGGQASSSTAPSRPFAPEHCLFGLFWWRDSGAARWRAGSGARARVRILEPSGEEGRPVF